MPVSAAQLAANRRNAQKSAGPRTVEGKEKSKFNALKFGLRAQTPVLPREDPQELRDRLDAWVGALLPTDAVEHSLVHDAVEYTWRVDRARNAQVARIEFNLENSGRDDAKREADEVLYLGQLLFSDARGLLPLFPHFDCTDARNSSAVPRISYTSLEAEPVDPPRLVLRLESTLGGCQWLLDQWAELRLILEEGKKWLPADKLKAIRLLGRQPLEAVHDRRVLMIFAACQAVEECPGALIPEIVWELRYTEREPYAERLAARGIDELTPKNPAAGRQALLEIVDRATTALNIKADEHRRHAEVNAALLADCLSFDDSKEGERLRRFELAASRGIARSLDTLLKLRRKAAQPDSSRPADTSTFAGDVALAGKTENAGMGSQEAGIGYDVFESTSAASAPAPEIENATTEPISASEPAVTEAAHVEQAPAAETKNATTEAISTVPSSKMTAADLVRQPAAETKNATNEAISASEPAVTETAHVEQAPAAESKNATTEAISAVPTSKIAAADLVRQPAAESKNATNEPNRAGVGSQNGGTPPRQIEGQPSRMARALDDRKLAEAAEARNREKPVDLSMCVPDALLKDALALQWMPGTLVQEIIAAGRKASASRAGEKAASRVHDP